MTKLTFNSENWTGTETVIDVVDFAGGFRFEQYGEQVDICDRQVYDADDMDFVMYGVQVNGESVDWKVGKSKLDEQWEATNWDGSMSRFGDTPAEAVSKIMSMLW